MTIHDDDCFCRGCYASKWPTFPGIRKLIEEAKRAIEREKVSAQDRHDHG